MILNFVGSRERNDNTKESDFDYITTENLDDVKKLFNIKKIIKNGKKYIQFITTNNEHVDIWKVKPEYFESNKFLRTLDKGHFIGLANAVKKLNGTLNFDGIKFNNKVYPIIESIKNFKELKKFRKYIK
jgi:hypothetical protein